MKQLNKRFFPFFCFVLSAFLYMAQAQTISGNVTDENGVPLPGATVLLEGTTTGVSTDFDGNYSIQASQGQSLIFSFVCYTSQTVPIGVNSQVNVQLLPDNELDEVVVTALGIKRNTKALGYSVTQVGGDEINTIKNTNAINSLQGKIAGVQISGNATGAKGSSRVIIRGNSSLSGNNQPLYVVDGITINNKNLGSAGVWGGADSGDGISALNPDEVASISVLKGGAAAALYGSRASNGVILITTKSGAVSEGLGVEFNSSVQFDDIRNDPYDPQTRYGQGRDYSTDSDTADTYANWGVPLDGSSVEQWDGVSRPYSYKGKLFKEVTNHLSFKQKHKENKFDDFQKQVLLPHKLSQFGPALAVADVNNDGLDDYYIGGASGQVGKIMIQNDKGDFSISNEKLWIQHRILEDTDALFFDADLDGDQDLFVLSGGNEFEAGQSTYQDRLYINDGTGHFTFDKERLPSLFESGGTVKGADFDGDGDLDLFVGNRIVPWEYPMPPPSYLLENNGGFFEKHTESVAILDKLGMVTDATWVDYNSDGFLDLVVVGEWMPVTFIENRDGSLKIDSNKTHSELSGWWFSVASADLDQDGDQDLILGNIGENYKYKTSPQEPLELYYNDFDGNGQKDIVLTYYNYGNKYPLRGFSCSSQQIPSLKNKIASYEEFASSNFNQIYSQFSNFDAYHLKASTFENLVLLNNNQGGFMKIKLPVEAQFSSINDILCRDFDEDGNLDLLLIGNLYVSEIETPRNDAGIGLYLRGKGKGFFEVLSVKESGFFAPYDAKKIGYLVGKNKNHLIVGNNNEVVQFFEVKKREAD